MKKPFNLESIEFSIYIHYSDPSQITLIPWLNFCVNIGRFAERQGLG